MPNAFDDLAPPTQQANAFDDLATPPAQDWDNLFKGVDGVETWMPKIQRDAFASLVDTTDDTREAKAAAINQEYVISKLQTLSPEEIRSNWGAVKSAFAKNALGMSDAEITDSALYDAIGENLKLKKLHFSDDFQKADAFGKMKMLGQMFSAMVGDVAPVFWDGINKPFVALPSAPQLPDVPSLGVNNPAVIAGVWNSIKPILEGTETPLGVVTLAAAAPLKVAATSSQLAKAALIGLEGGFTALMAKATYDTAKDAPAVFSDPNATLQQKIEAVGTPVATGAIAVLGALGTAFEIQGIAKAKVTADKLQGRTVGEAARVIRDEAAKATDPAEAAALTAAAERLEALTPEAMKAQEQAAKAPQNTATAQDGSIPAPSPETVANAAESGKAAIVGIKNAAIDAELEAMGLPKATHGEKLAFEEARVDAAKRMETDPLAGQKLIAELEANPRPVTGKENALLLHEMNRLRIERDAADTAFLEAVKSGDPQAIDSAQMRVTRAIEDYGKAANVDTLVGTENAQGLALRQMMMREDYSLASMERQMMVANEGKALTPEQTAKVRELHAAIADAEKAYQARLKAAKTRLAKQTVELEQRLATGNLAPKEKPLPLHLDMEANRLKAEADQLKLEFRQELEKQRYEAMPAAQKVAVQALNGWDSSRAVLAGYEASVVGRQGAVRLLSNPISTVSMLSDAFRALVADRVGARAIDLKTLSDPAAAGALRAKLALMDQGAALSRQEELYMGKLVGSIPGVRNFEQFSRVFLNKMRLDMWKELRQDFPTANEKLIAAFINSATGRGSLGPLEASAVMLNRGLFSPKFLASRVQQSTGYYLWKAAITGDRAAAKAVARQYARTMTGYALFSALTYTAFKAYSDEEVSISSDRLSTDFGKIKVGQTRLDMGGGIIQPLVFINRLVAGEKTTASGDRVPIRGDDVPFGGKDAYDEMAKFIRSKFNPSLSKTVDFSTGKNVIGEPATVTDLFYPATYGDIVQAFEEHGVPEATAISIMAFFGVGIQTHSKNKVSRTEFRK